MAREGFSGATALEKISINDLRLFHSADRKLYTILAATEILQDPVESLLVMAVWLWLERVGFTNLIQRILSQPAMLVSELADEALICINLVNNHLPLLPYDNINIPLTQNLTHITLQFFRDNQNLAKIGIDEVHNDICAKVFADIKNDVIARNETPARLPAENRQLLRAPNGFSPSRQLYNSRVVPAEERTMFVTFSKGYPVTEWEVRDYLTKMFGNCIESFYMQNVRSGDEQALFARIVFPSPDIINILLRQGPQAKFKINGKHVWMLKFVPRQPKTVPTQQQAQASPSGII